MLGALPLPAYLELVHFATTDESLHTVERVITLLHIEYRLTYAFCLGNKALAQQKDKAAENVCVGHHRVPARY